jgi:hypothetical protein
MYVPPGLIFNYSTWCSLCIESFVRISEQTVTFSLYIINWLDFITVVESVYSAVRTDFLYKADYVSSLKGYLIYKNERTYCKHYDPRLETLDYVTN